MLPSRTARDPRIRNRRSQPCKYRVEELQVGWCERRESGGGFGEDAAGLLYGLSAGFGELDQLAPEVVGVGGALRQSQAFELVDDAMSRKVAGRLASMRRTFTRPVPRPRPSASCSSLFRSLAVTKACMADHTRAAISVCVGDAFVIRDPTPLRLFA
jgi:hypothetical protein